MISQMLARDPHDRPSFDRILSIFRGSIFPEYFYTFLKDYATSLSELPESSQRNHDFLKKVASQPGTKVDRLLDEWESISIHLEKGVDESELVLPLASEKKLTRYLRWTRSLTAQYGHFVRPELYLAFISSTQSSALPQPLPFCPRRGPDRPNHPVRGGVVIRRSGCGPSGSLSCPGPCREWPRLMSFRTLCVLTPAGRVCDQHYPSKLDLYTRIPASTDTSPGHRP